MFVPFSKPLVMTVRVVVMFATSSVLSLLYTMVMRLLMKLLFVPSMKTTYSLLTYINPGEYNISFSVK